MAGIINLPIVSKFDPKGITQAKSGLDGLKSATTQFAAVSAVAFAAAAAGAVAFGVQSLKAAAHSESVARSLEQMAKNSGAFGTSANDIKKASGEIMAYTKNLSNMIGVDDEILNSIVRGFLGVPDLAQKGVKGIENMVKVIADVAAGTGKDVQSIGMAFIKVAGDETTALGKLLRQGIVFTQAQKDMYQATLDQNGEIAAQDYLISELGKTYSGAAKAAANPFDVLTQNVKNFQEEVGVYLIPALQLFIDKLKAFVEKHGPDVKTAFENVGKVAMVLVDAFFAFSGWVADNPTIWTDIVAGLAIVTGAVYGLDAALSANPVGAVMAAIAGLIAFTVGVVLNWNQIIGGMVGGFQILFGGLLGMMEGFVNSFIDGINLAINAVNTLGANIATLPKADFGASAMIYAGIDTQRNAGLHGGSTVTGAPSYSHGQRGMRPMAAGGIVMSPMSNLIVGEAGPEAIIPLDKLGSMGYGSGGNNYSITVQAGVGDPQTIGQSIISYIKRYEKASGAVFASA